MNILKPHKKLTILSALLEGCSARATSRLTGCHLETVLKVLVEAGEKCESLMNDRIQGIRCEAVECDELWAYVGKKQRRLTKEELFSHSEFGDAYTFVGLDPSTKISGVLFGRKTGFSAYRQFHKGFKPTNSGNRAN